MNGRDLITRKFKQLLVALVFAAIIVLVGLYVESIPLMVTGVGLIWALSRFGYKNMRCPYCDTSLYKHLFKEAAIWASWISWSKSQNKECPSCKTNFYKSIWLNAPGRKKAVFVPHTAFCRRWFATLLHSLNLSIPLSVFLLSLHVWLSYTGHAPVQMGYSPDYIDQPASTM